MLLNFINLNRFLFLPTLVCTKNGYPVSKYPDTVSIINKGDNINRPKKEKKKSNNLIMQILN